MGKFQLKNIIPGCVFALLLFIMCLEGLTQIALLQKLLKHIDELLVLGCLFYLALHFRFLFQRKRLLVSLWLCFLAIGGISSLIFRYQGLIPSLIDAVVVISKFMVAYLSVYVYASTHTRRFSDAMAGTARIITLVLFLIGVHDLLMTPFFPLGEYRYFTNSLVLMFPHPTYLSAAATALLVLLGYTNKRGCHYPYMLMASFLGIMTLRGKAIAFFLVYWVLYICIMVFRNRHHLMMLLGGGVMSVFVGYSQIQEYFLTTTRYSPRQILMRDSLSLMGSHFPFGTGFGSFGSTIAQQYYSPLYYRMGYEHNDGMGPVGAKYLSDSFWPEIFAQFGLIGTLLFVAVLVLFVVYSIRMLRTNRVAGFTMLIIMVNMLINSLAESAFFNPTSFLLFAIFALCEAENPPPKPERLCKP